MSIKFKGHGQVSLDVLNLSGDGWVWFCVYLEWNDKVGLEWERAQHTFRVERVYSREKAW